MAAPILILAGFLLAISVWKGEFTLFFLALLILLVGIYLELIAIGRRY